LLVVDVHHAGGTEDQSRGSEVVRETLGDEFSGILVSDCIASYDPPNYRKHKGIAYHLQVIRKARERPDTTDPTYLDAWQEVFQRVISLYRERDTLPPAQFDEERSRLEAWVDRLLNQTCTACQAEA
jgi:hypothetical protein